MKECLNCKKQYNAKRASSKFCSVNCRVIHHQKHGKAKIKPVDLKVMFDAVLNAVEKLQWAKATPESFDGQKTTSTKHDEPFKYVKPIPKVAVDAIMRKYVEDKQDCTSKEEYLGWLDRLNADERLTSKQKEDIKNTRQYE